MSPYPTVANVIMAHQIPSPIFLKTSGCTFVGAVSADGYSYSSSIAIIDGKFVGLALDDVNESGKTEERINSWVEEIKKNL